MMETIDFAIIGAGISGINCAYRLKESAPRVKYVILEARESMGGTWDTWKYPGVRSDANIHHMTLAWHDWAFPRNYAQGAVINEYIKDAATKHHISDHIRFRHKVLSADWVAEEQQWQLSVDTGNGQHHSLAARFLIFGTGYFDYDSPLRVDIPGLERFRGNVINPQFWPTDYDYTNRNIAIIGSGSTAVSLVPSLVPDAAQITMVQRSPSYIFAPDNNPVDTHSYLPLSLVNSFKRVYFTLQLYFRVLLSYVFPSFVKENMRKATEKQLPGWIDYDIDFSPRYKPWDQRVCMDPGGVFYKSLHHPNMKVVTGQIDSVTEAGIRMQSGQSIDADDIVTATGFHLRFGGNVAISVDGRPMLWADRLIWNGCMLDGLPNLMLMIGYYDNAWILGADDTAHILGRLWKVMEKRQIKSLTPRVPRNATMETQGMWPSIATYVKLAEGHLPVYGNKGPWRPRFNPVSSWFHARWGNITTDLQMVKS